MVSHVEVKLSSMIMQDSDQSIQSAVKDEFLRHFGLSLKFRPLATGFFLYRNLADDKGAKMQTVVLFSERRMVLA